MAVRMSEPDKKELDRYIRNFVMKTLQVIVQARCGDKCNYTAKENSSLEWFSLPITDLQELNAVARKTLGTGPLLMQPINVEISLKEKENNGYIFLEVWSISMDPENKDPDVKISTGVYNRLSQALKSILVVTRVANAFRLSQRQKEDDYQLHYQFYMAEPNVDLLRGEVKTRHIAAAPTPIGTLHVKLSYTNSPVLQTNNRKSQLVDIKDDHFSHPSSRRFEPKPCNRKFRNPKSMEDLRILDSQEKQDTCTANYFSTSPPEGYIQQLPKISENHSPTSQDIVEGPKKDHKSEEGDPFSRFNMSAIFGRDKGLQVERPEDRPFANLMSDLPKPSADESSETLSEGSDTEDKSERRKEAPIKEEDEEDYSDASEPILDGASGNQSVFPNDFVMLSSLPHLELPFADSSQMSEMGKLGQFYREMLQAAKKPIGELTMTVNQDFLNTVARQIDQYEKEEPKLDEFLKTLSKDYEKEELSDS